MDGPGWGPAVGNGAATADVRATWSPPGWYPTAWGWRWWDGAGWGPMAPRPGSGGGIESEKTLAMFAHLSAFLGGIVVCAVIYAVSSDKPFARDHAREALNSNITFLIVSFLGMGVILAATFGGVALFASSSAAGGAGAAAFFIAFGLYFLAIIGHIVFAIIGAVRASRGEMYRYPICIRFLKD